MLERNGSAKALARANFMAEEGLNNSGAMQSVAFDQPIETMLLRVYIDEQKR